MIARRIRIWGLVVLVLVFALVLQAALPQWRFLPRIGGDLADGAVLAVILAALFC